MRYSGITALLVAFSGFVVAYPADDAIFNKLEPRCFANGANCAPDVLGECCNNCCAHCSVIGKRDDDDNLVERSYPYCVYFCGETCGNPF
jgi:hypothetical protein